MLEGMQCPAAATVGSCDSIPYRRAAVLLWAPEAPLSYLLLLLHARGILMLLFVPKSWAWELQEGRG